MARKHVVGLYSLVSVAVALIVVACSQAAPPPAPTKAPAAPTAAPAAATKAPAAVATKAPAAQPTAAQPAVKYPTKPITFVIPYGAGGGIDLMGRALAQGMEKALGQPVVVENKAGGGGAVALGALYQATPDGYTIGAGTGTNMTVAPHIVDVAYDPLKMSYVASYASYRMALVVDAKYPWKTVQEMAEWGKENPNKLVFGATGGWGLMDIGAALVSEKTTGFEYRTLPANSSAEGAARMLAGDSNWRIASPAASLQYIKDGSQRALLILSPAFPELEQMGIPNAKGVLGFNLTNPMVVIAPPGLPEPVRQKLEDAVAAAIKDPEIRARMDAIGEQVGFMKGSDIKAEEENLYKLYGDVAVELGKAKK